MRHGEILVGHGCSLLSVLPQVVTGGGEAALRKPSTSNLDGVEEGRLERYWKFAGDRLTAIRYGEDRWVLRRWWARHSRWLGEGKDARCDGKLSFSIRFDFFALFARTTKSLLRVKPSESALKLLMVGLGDCVGRDLGQLESREEREVSGLWMWMWMCGYAKLRGGRQVEAASGLKQAPKHSTEPYFLCSPSQFALACSPG